MRQITIALALSGALFMPVTSSAQEPPSTPPGSITGSTTKSTPTLTSGVGRL